MPLILVWKSKFSNTSVQAGIRAEQTNATGNSVTSQNKVSNHYLNLFPSIFIRHILSGNDDIGFSYTRRIDRPDYSLLNPFINFIDLYSYHVGNPYLKPQFTNAFELTYSYKKTIDASLGYSSSKNVISQIVTSDTIKKTLFITPDNIANYSSIDFDVTAAVKITDWWTADHEVTIFYARFNSPNLLGAPYSSGRVVFNFHMLNTIIISPTMNFEWSGNYRTKGLEGTFTIKNQYKLEAGISQSFLSKKLLLKATLSDVFNSFKLVTNSTLPSQNYNNYIKAESQIMRLTCSYRFGSTAIKGARERKKSSEEEQNRVDP